MILQTDIISIAHKKKVKTKTIDKDWVLGHFLNAFYSDEKLKQIFVFKGGTCLRKCYFEDYRFSEDLDFTLLDDKFTVDKQLLRGIIKEAEKNSGIRFHIDSIKLQKSNDIEQGYEVILKYWGADHKINQPVLPVARWQTKIKLDISFTEKLLTPVEHKRIFHDYPDTPKIINTIPVYSIKEIIAEKLRSLVQRNRPRDIYDLWFLFPEIDAKDYKQIYQLLTEKCLYKNIQISNINQFINDKKQRSNKRAWNSSLADHLPEGELPDFDVAYSNIKKTINEILKYNNNE